MLFRLHNAFLSLGYNNFYYVIKQARKDYNYNCKIPIAMFFSDIFNWSNAKGGHSYWASVYVQIDTSGEYLNNPKMKTRLFCF